MGKKSVGYRSPSPPVLGQMPLIHSSDEVARWLEHYWQKLRLPRAVADRLAVTGDRQEFAQWTGRRLNPMALGCYCYLPNASGEPGDMSCGEEPELLHAGSAMLRAAELAAPVQPALPGFATGAEVAVPARPDWQRVAEPEASDYRHLIFIEPDLLPISTEVTVAHELIHLSDRVQGQPRKHRCHGYDAISMDEAALTERDPEFLRTQLRDETVRREEALRRVRPFRYLYVCPVCLREYPRVRRYARPVSCGRCDRQYNPAFTLELHELEAGDVLARGTGASNPTGEDGGSGASGVNEGSQWGEAQQAASIAARRAEE
jgi:hypothetical protein